MAGIALLCTEVGDYRIFQHLPRQVDTAQVRGGPDSQPVSGGAEEAKTLVPSLENKMEDVELDELLKDLHAKTFQ